MKGVEKDYDFGNLDSFLKSGRWIRFPDTIYSNEIVISTYTATQLKIKLGDKVTDLFHSARTRRASQPRPSYDRHRPVQDRYRRL